MVSFWKTLPLLKAGQTMNFMNNNYQKISLKTEFL